MVTDRLTYLERKVSDMEREQSAQEVELTALAEQIKTLSIAVTELTAVLNRGRGALWGIVALTSSASAVVTWLGLHFGAKP